VVAQEDWADEARAAKGSTEEGGRTDTDPRYVFVEGE